MAGVFGDDRIFSAFEGVGAVLHALRAEVRDAQFQRLSLKGGDIQSDCFSCRESNARRVFKLTVGICFELCRSGFDGRVGDITLRSELLLGRRNFLRCRSLKGSICR